MMFPNLANLRVLVGATIVAALPCAPVAANPITIISDYGDRDGYNGRYDPDTTVLPFQFLFSSVPGTAATDPLGSDRNGFVHDGVGMTWEHNFKLPGGFQITAIDFEIVTFDNWGNPGSGLTLDGTTLTRGLGQSFFFDAVGELCPGGTADGTGNNGCAEITTYSVPSNLFSAFLDDTVVMTSIADPNASDGWIMDYARFSITGTVPVPAGGAVLLLAVGAARLLRRIT